MTGTATDRLGRFVAVARALVATGDLDPVYPWLRAYVAALSAPVWATLLYAAYYRVDSMGYALAAEPWQQPPRARVAHERRNLRKYERLREHLAVARSCVAMDAWPLDAVTALVRWQDVYARSLALRHNGPWAAYKWCDLATYVLGWPLEAPITAASGSGPHAGLLLLGEPTLGELRAALDDADVMLTWDQIETALCKFHGIITGHYTLGEDVRALEEQTRNLGVSAVALFREVSAMWQPSGDWDQGDLW